MKLQFFALSFAATLGTLSLVLPAEAALTMNGVTINGIRFNGMTLNATTPTLHRKLGSAATPQLYLKGSQLILHP